MIEIEPNNINKNETIKPISHCHSSRNKTISTTLATILEYSEYINTMSRFSYNRAFLSQQRQQKE